MSPKILFFDIETSPSLGWVWGKWEQNVIDFEKYWHILSFSAKWLDGKQITKGLIDYPVYKKDKDNDFYIVKEIRELFDEADVIVSHNGDEFDVKKVNARIAFNWLNPPSPYATIDTKKVAKRYFKFNSNSLNELGKELELGTKIETGGFELWKDCMSGNPASWRKMKEYNAQDVILLEKVYKHFLPWIKNHPNYGLYKEGEVCPNCGSLKLQRRGYMKTSASIFARVQCQDCGKWSRLNDRQKINLTVR